MRDFLLAILTLIVIVAGILIPTIWLSTVEFIFLVWLTRWMWSNESLSYADEMTGQLLLALVAILAIALSHSGDWSILIRYGLPGVLSLALSWLLNRYQP